jgi:Flp pilus assembly pilin Flp
MTRPRQRLSEFSLCSWLRQARGATAVEYLVALILCVLVVLGISKLFGETLYEKYKMGDARISDMERNQRRTGGGSGNDSNLVQAKEIDNANEGSGQNKAYVTRSRNGSLGGISEGDSQLSQEDQKRLMAKRLESSSGYSSQGGADEDGRGSGESKDKIVDPKMTRQQYALRGEKPPEQFRFNPFILIIIALLLLGLGYIMVKGNKEEG